MVCLIYNKHVELYVVLAAAYGPGSYATNALDIRGITKDVSAVSKRSSSTETPATAEGDPATDEDRNKDTTDAADAKDNEPAPSTRLPFLYVLLPLATYTAKLKTTIDMTTTKLISEHHLVLPPPTPKAE